MGSQKLNCLRMAQMPRALDPHQAGFLILPDVELGAAFVDGFSQDELRPRLVELGGLLKCWECFRIAMLLNQCPGDPLETPAVVDISFCQQLPSTVHVSIHV